MDGILFPFGAATSSTLAPLATGAAALTVDDNMTICDLGELGAATTLTITADAELRKGAILHVKALSDGTARTLTFAGDITAVAMTGVISKTKVHSFVFDGSKFLPLGAAVQID